MMVKIWSAISAMMSFDGKYQQLENALHICLAFTISEMFAFKIVDVENVSRHSS